MKLLNKNIYKRQNYNANLFRYLNLKCNINMVEYTGLGNGK